MRVILPIALLFARPTFAVGQWAPVTSGTDAEWRGLSAAGSSVVWASGTRGRYARSTDGGRTWHVDSVPASGTLDLRAK